MFVLNVFLSCAFEDTKFCIYKSKKELCKPEYGIPLNETSAFDGITNECLHPKNTYVYVVEKVTMAKVDIQSIRDANIFIIGISKDSQITLESSNMSTYDFLSIQNINIFKKDTTDFRIKKMELKAVIFTGFEKTSVFYGEELISDLNSIAYSTFKFTNVKIKVGKPQKFEPNWKVDGAIFCQNVFLMTSVIMPQYFNMEISS